jgi:hypothetical protein
MVMDYKRLCKNAEIAIVMKLLQTSNISEPQMMYEIITDFEITVHKFNITVKSMKFQNLLMKLTYHQNYGEDSLVYFQ